MRSTAADGAKPLTVLVECDTGGGRCGVQSPAQALALARQIVMAPGLRFGGLMTYPPARLAAADALAARRQDAARRGGDSRCRGSPAATARTCGTPATASSPSGGPAPTSISTACRWHSARRSWTDCALTVLATVVSRPTATRVVLDAGSKALSSDLLASPDMVRCSVHEDIVVKSLSEEHGVIELAEPSAAPRIGDRLRIIPNHACVVSNLFDEVHLISGDEVVETEIVAARGSTSLERERVLWSPIGMMASCSKASGRHPPTGRTDTTSCADKPHPVPGRRLPARLFRARPGSTRPPCSREAGWSRNCRILPRLAPEAGLVLQPGRRLDRRRQQARLSDPALDRRRDDGICHPCRRHDHRRR